ncbi:hypothetical protein FE257_009205 [Aspergillus nanangensis]|uniref:Uncharacterized protein n=1 Tax=Aspergillus nanangensis TaxID=2582783 RepID=A0AAD4CKI8_ASPNN|nr:hypothetical protein FE257_009205 [Aspergillus nanangensis]
MSSVTEFIHFHPKCSVKPEDPQNDEGQHLLQHFKNTKHQSGYISSAWGRAKEDENTIVWVVDWKDVHAGTQPSLLAPYLAPDTKVTVIFSTINPPISKTQTFTLNPVTELCALPFPSSLSPEEHRSLCERLANFRTALTENLPAGSQPTSWAMGQLERPGTLPHENSPSGQAMVHLLAVGWPSVDAHIAIKQTKEFTDSIAPIREKMLPPVAGLGMKHVSFQSV